MAYNKKTWLARLGQGLNKFIFNGGSKVTLDSAPDVVTQEGTPLSAVNMNDLEQRIADEFDEVNSAIAGLSSGIIFKGAIASSSLPTPSSSNVGWEYWLTDENTYAISDGTTWVRVNSLANTPDETDYAHALSNASTTQLVNGVKADLQTEVSERKATDSMLTARVENLEQKAGDYTTVQYRGTNAVPTGKAKYGLVKKIVGKSRAWNQGAPVLNSSNYQANYAPTISYSDGVCEFTATEKFGMLLFNSINLQKGHAYLFFVDTKVDSALSDVKLLQIYDGVEWDTSTDVPSSTSWTTTAKIVTMRDNITNPSFVRIIQDNRDSGFTKVYLRNLKYRDLTLIFPEGVPSTIAECVQKCPDLLKYDAYDAGSLVDTEVSGVESDGVNLCNTADFVNKRINSDGTVSDSIYWGTANSAIDIRPLSTITLSANSSINVFRIAEYDADGIFIKTTDSSGTSFTLTLSANTSKIKWGVNYNGASTVTKAILDSVEVQLQYGSSRTTYYPYVGTLDTLPLSQSVELESVESVAEILNLGTGKKTKPIGILNIGNLNFTKYTVAEGNLFRSEEIVGANITTDMGTGTPKAPFRILCGKYNNSSSANRVNMTVSCGIRNYLDFIDNSYSTAADFQNGNIGVYLLYELAIPDDDELVCDPILDNFIEVQGSGTIETVQEQTPVIDNSLDVGYLAL